MDRGGARALRSLLRNIFQQMENYSLNLDINHLFIHLLLLVCDDINYIKLLLKSAVIISARWHRESVGGESVKTPLWKLIWNLCESKNNKNGRFFRS